MKREATAIYIGDHKVGYRGVKNGVRGLLYKKGTEMEFKTCEMLLQDIYAGPCEEVNNIEDPKER